jgi:hypothetical protein
MMARIPDDPKTFGGHLSYRDPDTGRFITRERWEAMGGGTVEQFDDYEDYEDWDQFGEEEEY